MMSSMVGRNKQERYVENTQKKKKKKPKATCYRCGHWFIRVMSSPSIRCLGAESPRLKPSKQSTNGDITNVHGRPTDWHHFTSLLEIQVRGSGDEETTCEGGGKRCGSASGNVGKNPRWQPGHGSVATEISNAAERAGKTEGAAVAFELSLA